MVLFFLKKIMEHLNPSVNLFHRNILKLLMALLRDDVIFSHRASLWRQISLNIKARLGVSPNFTTNVFSKDR